MSNFPKLTKDTAPTESLPFMERSEKAFGRLPGLHAVMAAAPGLLEGYQELHRLFLATSFDNDEKTVVWQAINVEHACHYCVPAHTGIAKSMGVDDAISNALRDETPLPTARLEALRDFTLTMVRSRGNPTEADLKTFFEAGYSERHVLEVVLGVAQKVMSNYTNHLAKTPVDPIMQKFAWEKAAVPA
ncbi:carboxymuconolactone decarboxylase family protein [Celeribacter litoreus]|uniref:carboxymuconolactone decarboxylase family protein n=1 Tax=Celeribacter litoreus TaxID=2876714 RepID=UPI001CC9E074|nr:carboxymuconolactone decarboxylase family protein [Celeribacter litoreus]MCA0044580.1 carboxymuconolactone decarboxylase family protein [Celeribacter litoreus]